MKKIILICLMAFIACNLKAQTQNVDSLVNILETQKLTEKEQLELYEKLCSIYQSNNMENFMMYSKKGFQLAQKTNNKPMMCDFYKYLGIAYNDDYKNIDTTKICFEKALELALEIKDRKREAEIYLCFGNMSFSNIIARHLEYYLKALQIFENIGDKKNIAKTLCYIGECHRVLHNAERAIYYVERAKTLSEELNYDEGKMSAYYSLSDLCDDVDESIYYELKVVEIARKIGNKMAEVFALQGLVYSYCLDKKEYDTAEKYALEGLKIAEELGSLYCNTTMWTAASHVYLYQRRYEECKEMVLRSWEADSFNVALPTLTNLAAAYLYLGQLDEAHDFFQQYVFRIQEISGQQFQKNISEMEVKYETEKKELRIAALEKEKTLYTLIIIVSVVAALLAFGILFYRHKLNIQKRKQAEQQVKQLEQEKQLIATQAVIDGEAAERSRLARDLHDGLGGMLSIVKLNLKDMKGFSILDNFDIDHFNKAMTMLDQSIDELRRVAHHIMPESLMRYGLKVSLDDFCRAIPGAHFRFFGDDANLDNRLKILIYRCTYELVNNAMKHANAENINVQLMIDNGLISLSVHDDGKGFDPENVAGGSGLENVRIRVATYNGKMNIYSSPGKGTEVSIEIEPS
ncbi:MAG: sensor histidine kinase [Prevotellaceae bacterium]|jgi:signal transduction histidine kinase|nr:sensor histidine kinase [Prevotellaceae bacterium]